MKLFFDRVAPFALAAVLALAGGLKLANPAAFAGDIENFQLVSPLIAGALAIYLPWLELATAVGLCLPPWRRAASWVALAVLCGFTGALALARLRGLDIACGCFGGATTTPLGWALLRNAALLALGARVAWRAGKRTRSITPLPA